MNRDICDKTEFRSIFIGYQIIKALKITSRMRVLQGFDIKTNEDVLIKMIRLDNKVLGCCGHLTVEPTSETHKILAILNTNTLPRVLFNKRIQNYQIIIQTAPKGIPLEEYIETTGLTEPEVLRIFSRLFKAIYDLAAMKIRASELSMKNITVDENRKVRIYEIDWLCFDENITSEYEDRQIKCLLRMLKFILDKTPTEDEACGILSALKHLMTQTDQAISFSYLARLLSVSTRVVFKNVIVIDPLVVSEIKKLGLTDFNLAHVCTPDSPSFFIYRLVDENIVRLEVRERCKTHHALLDHLGRAISEKGILNINRMEDSILKALSRREEAKFTMINNRMSVIQSAIQRYSPLYWLVGCSRPGNRIFTELQLTSIDGWEEVLKAMRAVKIPTWDNGASVDVRDENVGLQIVMRLKRHGGTHSIVCMKEKGREIDFIHMVSEIVEAVVFPGLQG